MAVSFFSSDSLSALQAIKHNSQSSREDVVKEIVVVCHQLITRGTDIVLQWACLATRALTALRNGQPVGWGPLHSTGLSPSLTLTPS